MEALTLLLCLLLTAFRALCAESCGGNMTDWRGDIFSPQYPNNYLSNARCTWTIHSTRNATVSLTFTDVDLETCCDYIRVYNGSSTRHPLLGEIREFRNQSFKSSNNDLTVFFYSDSSVTRRGFHANWVFVEASSDDPCYNYTVLDNPWRATDHQSGSAVCDQNVNWFGWYRLFLHGQSAQMPDTCVDKYKCGTHAPLWLNGGHSKVEDGVVTRGVCGHWDNNCCNFNSTPIRVKACPGNYYVYEFVSPRVCSLAYCAVVMNITSTYTTITPETNSFDSNSCRNNCGYSGGSCSCHYSCQYSSNCCYDYSYYCSDTTIWPQPTTTANTPGSWSTDSNSCSNNCGYSGGSCSCHYSCQYNSNCCYDYSYYCSETTIWPQPAKEYVNCSSDNMVIVIQRSYLNSLGLSGNDLYVDDHLCRPSITSTEVVFSFPLDTCGTAKEMMNGNVSYTNKVRASPSQSGEITRQSQFLLRVGCRMEPDTMVQIFYKAREIINANITGTGQFGANIAFYTSSSFKQQIYDSSYEVNMNQHLYVQVNLNRPDSSLLLFLDTCVASPNSSDFKDHSHDLLRNGCQRDNTYYSYTSGQHYYARFSFQAFKFLRTHAYVYLQCKVIICPANDYNSRCRKGCRFRRKRSLDSTYHTNTVTLGPIKLKGE